MQFNWMFVIRNAPLGPVCFHLHPPRPAFTFAMLPWDLAFTRTPMGPAFILAMLPWDLAFTFQMCLDPSRRAYRVSLPQVFNTVEPTNFALKTENTWNEMTWFLFKNTQDCFLTMCNVNQTQAKPNKDSVLIRHAAPPTNKDFPASWHLWQVQCWVLWTISGSRFSGRRQPCFSEERPVSTRDSLRRPSSSKSAIALRC